MAVGGAARVQALQEVDDRVGNGGGTAEHEDRLDAEAGEGELDLRQRVNRRTDQQDRRPEGDASGRVRGRQGVGEVVSRRDERDTRAAAELCWRLRRWTPRSRAPLC